MYLIVTELIDGVSGALAAFMLVSLSWFRVYSILLTSHVPMLLLGLLLVWAWMRWRGTFQMRWAVAMGIAAGWAAITRQADAALFGLPVAIAVLHDVWKRGRPRTWLTLLAMVAAAAPFLALQVAFDLGVTGHPFRPPYGYYLEHDQPGSSIGFHRYDPSARPRSPLAQKQELYDRWIRPKLPEHTPGNIAHDWLTNRLPMLVDTAMPCRLFLLFAPIGILGLTGARRWVLGATLPLFAAVYTFNPFFLEHYAIVAIPSVVLMILLGGQALTRSWPAYASNLSAAFTALLLMACATSLWEVDHWLGSFEPTPATANASSPTPHVSDETFISPYLRIANRDLMQYGVEPPAVVLFHYHPNGTLFGVPEFIQEPVYNTDVAWPDDAAIIHAHDLGPVRNREIFAYYAKIQPDRTFWIFDATAGEDTLRKLGTARELAAR